VQLASARFSSRYGVSVTLRAGAGALRDGQLSTPARRLAAPRAARASDRRAQQRTHPTIGVSLFSVQRATLTDMSCCLHR
jgi:hypothetical protein